MNKTLKRTVDAAIYASVFLGILLLYETIGLVPGFLLASLFGGAFVYGIASLLVARGLRWAYYVVFVLALLVLVVSLPQPEHYQFAATGQIVPLLIFVAGSVLQAFLIVTIPVYLWRSRVRKWEGSNPEAAGEPPKAGNSGERTQSSAHMSVKTDAGLLAVGISEGRPPTTRSASSKPARTA